MNLYMTRGVSFLASIGLEGSFVADFWNETHNPNSAKAMDALRRALSTLFERELVVRLAQILYLNEKAVLHSQTKWQGTGIGERERWLLSLLSILGLTNGEPLLFAMKIMFVHLWNCWIDDSNEMNFPRHHRYISLGEKNREREEMTPLPLLFELSLLLRIFEGTKVQIVSRLITKRSRCVKIWCLNWPCTPSLEMQERCEPSLWQSLACNRS